MSNIPLADQLAEAGELIPPRDSFELLSKPIGDLTDDDLLRIANDLRAKRRKFLQGIADKPGTVGNRKKAEPVTDEQKKATTAHLLGELDSMQLVFKDELK
jgi:hypothetical protein